MRPLIDFVMIVKNESDMIRETCLSVKPFVDHYSILDTGSTDGTQDIIREAFGKNVPGTVYEGPFVDFGTTRNRALELSEKDTNAVFMFTLNGDDILKNGASLRAFCERERDDKIHGAYHVGIAHSNLQYDSSRLIRTDGKWRFTGVTHEVLIGPTPNTHPACGRVPSDVTVLHDTSKLTAESLKHRWELDLKLLGNEIKTNTDPRWFYYYAQTLQCLNRHKEAHTAYMKRAKMPAAFVEETFCALWQGARAAESAGLPWPSVQQFYLDAFKFRSHRAEPLFDIGAHYYEKGDHALAYIFFLRASRIPFPKDDLLFVDKEKYDWMINDRLGVSAFNIFENEEGEAAVRRALKACPGHPSMTKNLELFQERKGVKKVAPAVQHSTEKQPEAPCSKPEKGLPSVIIWTGNAWEEWSPKSLSTTGIGGSELAAAHMAKELAALGHRVTVLGNLGGPEHPEGIYDGALWLNHRKAVNNPSLFKADVFVCSRQPGCIDFVTGKLNILWLHDTNVGEVKDETFDRFDQVMCLTEWHKQYTLNFYPHLSADKIVVTRNGIDLTRFGKKEVFPEKTGNKIIFTSSPDRGLDRLIEMMPEIKKQVPDVELHAYYGFDVWKKSAQWRPEQLPVIEKFEKLIDQAVKDGLLVWHGRQSQAVIAEAFVSSKVWAYPTNWPETSCQLPGSLIFTAKGVKNIEDIDVGDEVLTHLGRFRKVTKLIKKEHEGDIFSIKRKMDFRPIVITPEHPIRIAAFHKRSDSKGRRPHNLENEKLSWKMPGDVVPDLDWLITPAPPSGDRKSVLISDYVDGMEVKDGKIGRNHNHPLWGKIENEVNLTPELMWMLGYFAADGCAGRAKSRKSEKTEWYSSIVFAHHSEKKLVAGRIAKFFGKAHTKKTSPHGMTTVIHSSPWANFLKKVVGAGVNKRLPPFIWECSRELQGAFTKGLFEGDGSVRRERRFGYTSISPSLAYGAAHLLAGQEQHPSITYSVERRAYTVEWTVEPKKKQFHITTEGAATRVQSVEKSYYKGLVYNFEVEEDRSYVTDRTIVHNCITAMEAQAAGCVPVTSAYAALNETVKSGVLLNYENEHSPNSESYRNAFVEAVVLLLKNDGMREMMAKKVRDFSFENFSWSGVANDWSYRFSSKFLGHGATGPAKLPDEFAIVNFGGEASKRNFAEVEDVLSTSLKYLGYNVELREEIDSERRNIVLCGERDLSGIDWPSDTIVYNLEPIFTKDAPVPPLSPRYEERLRKHEVWDYSKTNIEELAERGIMAAYCPLGYAPELTRIKVLPAIRKDIDVLFYGNFNERRKAIIDGLRAADLKVVVMDWIAGAAFGAERDKLISRSKIVLNIHTYEGHSRFETVRVVPLLANGCLVVTEDGPDVGEFDDAAISVPYKDLVKTCLQTLADEELVKFRGLRGMTYMQAHPMTDTLRQLLAPPATIVTRKIFDCFPFNDELDLLELRLKTLKDVVTTFVLVESPTTHTGIPKELVFEKNKDRFKNYNIKHVVIDDVPVTDDPWVRGRHQRNAIMRGLEDCGPDDLVILSDLDEIPRPEVASLNPDPIMALDMTMYYYKFNWRTPFPWRYSKIFTAAYLRTTTPQHIRDLICDKVAPNMGWHFSYMNGGESIANKIASYEHQEYNKPEYTDLKHIQECVEKGQDLFGRFSLIHEENPDLPAAVTAEKYKWKDWFTQQERV